MPLIEVPCKSNRTVEVRCWRSKRYSGLVVHEAVNEPDGPLVVSHEQSKYAMVLQIPSLPEAKRVAEILATVADCTKPKHLLSRDKSLSLVGKALWKHFRKLEDDA